MKITKALLMTLCLSFVHAMDPMDVQDNVTNIYYPTLINQIGWTSYKKQDREELYITPIIRLRMYTSLDVGNPDLLNNGYDQFSYVFPLDNDSDARLYCQLTNKQRFIINKLRELEMNMQYERNRLKKMSSNENK